MNKGTETKKRTKLRVGKVAQENMMKDMQGNPKGSPRGVRACNRYNEARTGHDKRQEGNENFA